MNKPSEAEPSRGVVLIDEVIRAIESGDPGELDNPERAPLTQAQIDSLMLPGGCPLPPSLRRWLAFDATCLQELFSSSPPDPPALRAMDLPALAQRYVSGEPVDDEAGGWFIPLRSGVGVYAMYVGTPDAAGEYPVVDVHVSDLTGGVEVEVTFPGLDVYLAWICYLVEDPEEIYEEALAEARERNPFVTDEEMLELYEEDL